MTVGVRSDLLMDGEVYRRIHHSKHLSSVLDVVGTSYVEVRARVGPTKTVKRILHSAL